MNSSQSNESVASVLKAGIGANNPVLVLVLGICSALAVTGTITTTLVMGASLMIVTGLSCLMVSALRHTIPHTVRLMVQMMVISVFVILVNLYLQAYHYGVSKALGPYVGLIITNCIVLGRTEGFALRHGPWLSFMDGLANGAGYALVLLCISVIREFTGAGCLMGHRLMPDWFEPAMFMRTAPGAFITLGIVIWIIRGIAPAKEERAD